MMKRALKKRNLGVFGVCLLSTIFVGTAASAAPTCETHWSCEADQPCECTVAPSSAYDRYFYLDFHNLQNKSHYTCSFNSVPATLHLDLGKSTLPPDSEYKCVEGCPQFPGKILLDTTKVVPEKSTMIIRYFVPASDMPNEVKALCKKD